MVGKSGVLGWMVKNPDLKSTGNTRGSRFNKVHKSSQRSTHKLLLLQDNLDFTNA